MISTILLLLGSSLVSCQSVQKPESRTPATSPDVSQTTVSPTAQETQAAPQRVVVLTSLSADIIYHLDSSKLVGIPGSRLLRQNPEFAAIPTVSEGQTPPSLEKILALKPDLVIGAVGFHDQVLAKLTELNIATLSIETPNWQSLRDLTQTLADRLEVDATALLQRYDSFLPDSPSTSLSSPSPSVLALVSDQPILVPNKDSWAGNLFTQFQVNNLAAELQGDSPQQGYLTLSPEKVLEADPDLLIVVNAGDQQTLETLKSASFWNRLSAVQNDRVYLFDYYGLVNPGSIGAIEKACQQLQQLLSTHSQS